MDKHAQILESTGRAAGWFVATVLIAQSAAFGSTYYIDSASGDDAHTGLGPDEAWRSLAPAGREFGPGDEILLRAGCVWEGQALQMRGSGTENRPIRVSRYGLGSAPILAGDGKVPAVVRVDNPQFWEIENLDISNKAPGESPLLRGVEIHAADCGWRHHLVLRNLAVHDITGPHTHYQDGDSVRKSYGGIVFLIEGHAVPTAWDDVQIVGCSVRDASAIGVVFVSPWTKGHRAEDPATWFPSRRVVIRGNAIERTAHNGLIIRACVNPLVEHNLFRTCAIEGSGNACFSFDCDGAVFQFNESCFTKYNPGDSDASGYDSDWNCRNTVFQCNYSHDNDYGFILLCSMGRGFNDGTIVRYNVSQNDGGNLIRVSGTVTHSLIYNNTLYARRGMSNPRTAGDPPRVIYFKSWNGWSDGTTFENNVIYNDCAEAVYEFGQSRNNHFDHNLFYGHHPKSEPADSFKLTADPLLANPGKAEAGWEAAVEGYSPAPSSPVIGAGIVPYRSGELLDYSGRLVVERKGAIDLGALLPSSAGPWR